LHYQVRGHWAQAPLKNPESGIGGERHMERATPSVLIVDDDVSVRRIMVELVKSRGYRVEEASDGEDAWRQLQRERLDLVVSDHRCLFVMAANCVDASGGSPPFGTFAS
jgi:PleD family two-component response regulator